MVQLIKKGGLRERANRSRRYQGSENTETTLQPNAYKQAAKKTDLDVQVKLPEPPRPLPDSMEEHE